MLIKRSLLHWGAVPHPPPVLPIPVEHIKGSELAHFRWDEGGLILRAVSLIRPIDALVDAVTPFCPRVTLLSCCGVAGKGPGRILRFIARIYNDRIRLNSERGQLFSIPSVNALR